MNHNSAGNAVVVNKPNSSSEVKDQFSPRYSVTEEDNLGDPLSEQQKEYFANSKIRDERVQRDFSALVMLRSKQLDADVAVDS